MTQPPPFEPVVSLGYAKDPDGTYTATMTVSGLPTERVAQAALDYMQHLFCADEIPPEEVQ